MNRHCNVQLLFSGHFCFAHARMVKSVWLGLPRTQQPAKAGAEHAVTEERSPCRLWIAVNAQRDSQPKACATTHASLKGGWGGQNKQRKRCLHEHNSSHLRTHSKQDNDSAGGRKKHCNVQLLFYDHFYFARARKVKSVWLGRHSHKDWCRNTL